MKTCRFAALLAAVLTLTASVAQAARDDTLIQQTRKNQLAHDTQAKHDQDKQAASAATGPQPQSQQRQHG